MKIERITNQKKIILEYLKSVKSHPSAKMVYRVVKRKLPQISLATVYRILNAFKEKGEIIEIPLDVARYDGDTSFHIHFICQKCDKIFDIYDQLDFLKKKKMKVGKIKNYQICRPPFGKSFITQAKRWGTVKRWGVYLYGQCKSCQSKK